MRNLKDPCTELQVYRIPSRCNWMQENARCISNRDYNSNPRHTWKRLRAYNFYPETGCGTRYFLRWFPISGCMFIQHVRHDDIYGTCYIIFLHLENLDWWFWSLKKRWPELMFRVGNPWVFWRRCLLRVSTVHWLWNWRWHLSLVSRLAFGCANVNGCQSFLNVSMFVPSMQKCFSKSHPGC